MLITLIVCTRNRCDPLAQALPYFEALQSGGATFELVFVDNGSTDGTGALLDQFCKRHAAHARWVAEPRPGLSAARNKGLAEARGDIIAFTDDDCYPAPDFVQRIADCFDDPDIGYIGGRILLFDPSDHPITIQTSEDRVELPAHAPFQVGLIHGANFAFRRNVVNRVGWFDERLGAGARFLSAEDLDYLARAAAHGFAGVYDPRPVVHHHHRRRTAAQVNRLEYGYDLGRGAFYAKALTDKALRRASAKPVYWALRNNVARMKWRMLSRELWGAARFLASERGSKAQPAPSRPGAAGLAGSGSMPTFGMHPDA